MGVIANHGRFSRGAAISSLAGNLFFYETDWLSKSHMKLEIEAYSKRIYTSLTVEIVRFIFLPKTGKHLIDTSTQHYRRQMYEIDRNFVREKFEASLD
jgi:hypothetical protein